MYQKNQLFMQQYPQKPTSAFKEKTMKPFNLEEALAGKPVVTRSGLEVTQITLFTIDNRYPVHAVVGGGKDVSSFMLDGSYIYGEEGDMDLFMATTKKQGFINIYQGKGLFTLHAERTQGLGAYAGVEIHPTQEAADAAFRTNPRIAVATFEYEE
jgi:hypothetical protein